MLLLTSGLQDATRFYTQADILKLIIKTEGRVY